MHMIGRGSRYGFALFTLSGLLLSGCGSEFDDASTDIERREEPVIVCNQPDGCCDPAKYVKCQNFGKRTPNGYTVGVTTYICRDTASSTTPSATCLVNPGDYAIGGGASASAFAAAPTSSLPILGLNGGWTATSAGILGPVTHTLHTYAIGLQVVDSSFRSVNLGNDIHEYDFSANTGDPNRLGGTVRVPTGDLLIGGGWSAGGGAFAVDAYATGMSRGTWHVNGKQFRAGAARLNGVAIGISLCLPAANPIFCFNHRDIIEATSDDGTIVEGALADNTHEAQFVVGVGAISSSWERPIGGLNPRGAGGFGSPSQYGEGYAYTVAPTGDLGHVTAQIMTMGF